MVEGRVGGEQGVIIIRDYIIYASSHEENHAGNVNRDIKMVA